MRVARAMTVLCVVLAGSVALADVYQLQPSPADLYDLSHDRAYRWGIDLNIPEADVVTSASLFFNNIRNYNWGDNDLYVTLIDNASVGVSTYYDGQYWSNYFASWGVELVHYHNLPATAQDISYNLDAAELDTLNTYLGNDNFGLGFDPDCHFYNCGVTLTLVTEPEDPGVSIPEPAAGSILLGALGMLIARRKRQ